MTPNRTDPSTAASASPAAAPDALAAHEDGELPAPPRLDPGLAASLPDPTEDLTRFLEGVATQGDVVAFSCGGLERVLLNLPDVVHAILAEADDRMRETRIFDGARKVVGDGLITTGGPNWRPRRLVVQRELSYRNVRRHAELFTRNTLARIGQWPAGGEIDLQAEILQLTLDNLGDAVFASDFRAFRAVLRRATEALTAHIDTINKEGREDPAAARELDDAVAALDEFVERLIAERRIAPTSGRDVLGVLVEAAARADAAFDDRWACDEAVMLITAGHETTAFTSTMACYLLARTPEVAVTLRGELRDAVARGVPLARLADEVVLARHLVEETLRLYPPVAALHRTAIRDMDVGGYRIPKGTILVLSPWVIQRDPRAFPNPVRFDPWRFAGERRKALPRLRTCRSGLGRASAPGITSRSWRPRSSSP